jgi:hypothetical protein
MTLCNIEISSHALQVGLAHGEALMLETVLGYPATANLSQLVLCKGAQDLCNLILTHPKKKVYMLIEKGGEQSRLEFLNALQQMDWSEFNAEDGDVIEFSVNVPESFVYDLSVIEDFFETKDVTAFGLLIRYLAFCKLCELQLNGVGEIGHSENERESKVLVIDKEFSPWSDLRKACRRDLSEFN